MASEARRIAEDVLANPKLSGALPRMEFLARALIAAEDELERLRARLWAHHEITTLSAEALADSLGGTCGICANAEVKK